MRGFYRVAAQSARWARFAAVDVDVVPTDVDHVVIADDIDELTRYEATAAVRRALSSLPGHHRVTIAKIQTSSVDTGTGDIFAATARAVWNALGLPGGKRDVGFFEQALIERKLAELHGRRLMEVTESRHLVRRRA